MSCAFSGLSTLARKAYADQKKKPGKAYVSTLINAKGADQKREK